LLIGGVAAQLRGLPDRGAGQGFEPGRITHLGLDFLVSLTVLTLVNLVTKTGLFWIYAAFGIAGLVFFVRYLPETKGRTLEQVEDDLRARAGSRSSSGTRGSPEAGSSASS
jgi:hypothetical protein